MHLQLNRSIRIFNSTTCTNLYFLANRFYHGFKIYNANIEKYILHVCKMRYASCFSLILRARVIFRAAGTSTVVGNDSLCKCEQLTREIQYTCLMREALTDRGLRISRSATRRCVIFEGAPSSPKLLNENQRCDLANMLRGRISTLIT